jgi:predicted MPP superfamily phosphohydrolase
MLLDFEPQVRFSKWTSYIFSDGHDLVRAQKYINNGRKAYFEFYY